MELVGTGSAPKAHRCWFLFSHEPLEIIEERFLVSGIPRLNLINVIQCVTVPSTGPGA